MAEVTAYLGGAACRVTLDDEDPVRVGSFSRQSAACRHPAGLQRVCGTSLPAFCWAARARAAWWPFKRWPSLPGFSSANSISLVYTMLVRGADLGIAQFAFGLALELCLPHGMDRDDADEALAADIGAGQSPVCSFSRS